MKYARTEFILLLCQFNHLTVLEEWENHLDYQVLVHLDQHLYDLDERHDSNDDNHYHDHHVVHLDMNFVGHHIVEMMVIVGLDLVT
jgi:hypothetical protein